MYARLASLVRNVRRREGSEKFPAGPGAPRNGSRSGLSGKLFAVGRRSMALEEELTNGRKPGPKSQISKK